MGDFCGRVGRVMTHIALDTLILLKNKKPLMRLETFAVVD